MSNELTTMNTGLDLANMTFEDFQKNEKEMLARMTGALPQTSMSSSLPMLKINYQADWVERDVNGEEVGDPISLPRGQWTIQVQNDEGTFLNAYAKDGVFEPYFRGNRYQAYSDNEYVLNTIIFSTWGEACVDDNGGEWKAGDYKRRAVEAYPKIASKIKCQHVILGNVTLEDAKDMFGNSVEVVDQPCMLIAKGSSYNSINELFNEIKDKDNFAHYKFRLNKTKRQTAENSDVVYFTMHPTWISAAPNPITEERFKILSNFLKIVRDMNEPIFKEYMKQHTSPSDLDIVIDVSGDALDADFIDMPDDPLPDDMAEKLMAG